MSLSNPTVDDDETSRRGRILDAARDVFSEVGFGTARVDEIARRARVNKALIYYYYSNKEGLYDAVVEASIEGGMPIWDAVRIGSFHEWLTALSEVISGPERRAWTRIMAMEGLADNGSRPLVREAERAAAWRGSVQLLIRAQAKGELDSDIDSEMLLLLFVTSAIGSRILPQFTRTIAGLASDSEGFTERLERFHLMLADRLSPPAPRRVYSR